MPAESCGAVDPAWPPAGRMRSGKNVKIHFYLIKRKEKKRKNARTTKGKGGTRPGRRSVNHHHARRQKSPPSQLDPAHPPLATSPPPPSHSHPATAKKNNKRSPVPFPRAARPPQVTARWAPGRRAPAVQPWGAAHAGRQGGGGGRDAVGPAGRVERGGMGGVENIRRAGGSDPAPPPGVRESERAMLRWFDRVGRLTAPHVTFLCLQF